MELFQLLHDFSILLLIRQQIKFSLWVCWIHLRAVTVTPWKGASFLPNTSQSIARPLVILQIPFLALIFLDLLEGCRILLGCVWNQSVQSLWRSLRCPNTCTESPTESCCVCSAFPLHKQQQHLMTHCCLRLDFLCWNYGTMIVFFWNKASLGHLNIFVPCCVRVRWQCSQTYSSALTEAAAAVYFLKIIKTMQVIHLIKLLWDTLTWVKSYKLIRHLEVAAIWFGFHNRDWNCTRDLCLQSVVFWM